MSIKMLVALCCLSASLASQALENDEGDAVALLQSQIEEKLVDHQTATMDSETSAYNVANALDCATKEDKVVDTDVLEVVASETASKQPISTQATYSSDPPGASSTRAILRLMCLFLFLDGLRRWWLQKQPTSMPKQQTSASVQAQADTQDEEAMKRNWAELVGAAKNGDESRFKKASVHQSTVTASDPWGCTALHFAAVGGSVTITQELVKHGAEVDAVDADDETPLHFAARAGHTRICEVLVTSGAKVDVVNKKGLTPFVVAGESNKEQACRFLADHGAGVAGLTDEELPPLVVSQIVRKMFAA